jgi:DNA-binding HxlR family transcriptional regulator
VTPGSGVTKPRHCSIAGALEVVGEKWSLLVVRELFLGVGRFSEIAANTAAPRDILTTRLRRLEDVGVVERSKYSNRPPRYEYRLTRAGRDLLPAIMALKQWGDRHVSGEVLPPVYAHSCGAIFEPRMDCAVCGEPADSGSLTRRDASVRRVHEGDGTRVTRIRTSTPARNPLI